LTDAVEEFQKIILKIPDIGGTTEISPYTYGKFEEYSSYLNEIFDRPFTLLASGYGICRIKFEPSIEQRAKRLAEEIAEKQEELNNLKRKK